MDVSSKLTNITGLENIYRIDDQVNPPWPFCGYGRNQSTAKRSSLPPILPKIELALGQEEHREGGDRRGYYRPQRHVHPDPFCPDAEEVNETRVAGHLPTDQLTEDKRRSRWEFGYEFGSWYRCGLGGASYVGLMLLPRTVVVWDRRVHEVEGDGRLRAQHLKPEGRDNG
jgi:hypothetical protein